MDASKSDVDFDSYWDEEARNPNRNRIRIGRQYQAQCPAILKSGESDGRKLEDLETLTWNPHNPLSSDQLNQYFAIAKSIGLFIQAIDTCQDGIEETECLEQENCTLRPFEILDSGTKCILEAKPDRPVNNNNNSTNSNNVITSPEKQSVTTRQRLQQQQQQEKQLAKHHHHHHHHHQTASNVGQQKHHQQDEQTTDSSTILSSSSISSSSSPLKQCSNTRIQTIAKGLTSFILSHHSPQSSSSSDCQQQEHDKLCKFTSSTAEQAINLGSTEKYNVKTLAKLLMGQWNDAEAKVFAQAIKECGKNFSAIKKDYLPWKSVRSIIEFYYLTVDKEKEQKRKQRKVDANKIKSPNLPENKKKKNTNLQNNSNTTTTTNTDVNNKNNSNDTNNNSNKDNNSDDTNDHSDEQNKTKQQNDQSNHECTDQEISDELIQLAKGLMNKNGGNICLDTTKLFPNSANILNGNNTFLLSPEAKHLFVPGQEVKPLKAKPILSQHNPNENGSLDNNGKTNLGSLNLYLHGELVLCLNAQQQDSGQKWVESMGTVPLRRKHLSTLTNGLHSGNSSSRKRSALEAKFKEEPDDISLGAASASDDDSMTSNESSSLVASSPSSSSTITTSAAKKARVKVDNHSNMNGNSTGTTISSPNGRSKTNSMTSETPTPSLNGSSKSTSNNYVDNTLSELDIKKKLFEYCNQFNSEEMQLLLASTLAPFIDPPKAHSNSSSSLSATNGSKDSFSFSPIKLSSSSSTTKSSDSKSTSSSNQITNGYTNGFIGGNSAHSSGPGGSSSIGPVDLTSRKSSSNHYSSNDHMSTSNSKPQCSPSRHQSQLSPLPKAAHSNSSASALFSLPAPPPRNVPGSPNNNNNNGGKSSGSKKSSFERLRNHHHIGSTADHHSSAAAVSGGIQFQFAK